MTMTRKELLTGALAGAGAAVLPSGAARAAGGASSPLAGERLHRDVRRLCALGPRRTGTPAEHRAARFLAKRLRQAGLRDVVVDAYGFRQWKLQGHEVTLVAGDGGAPLPLSIAAFPMWATKASLGEADLVYAGLGSQAELAALGSTLKGKFILVDGKVSLNVFPTLAALGTYWEAAKYGVAGVLAPSDAPGNRVRLIAPGANQREKNPIPAFTVGRESFDALRRAALGGGARVRWRLDATWVDGVTHDVVGTLPGSGAGPRALMACAHFDSMFTGALDDATGVAGLIGLAAHFAAKPPAERPKTMTFLGVTGHDTGFPHLGVRHWIDTHPRELERLDAYCTLDHLAAEGVEDLPGGPVPTGMDEKRLAVVSNHPVLQALVTEVLAKYRLLPGGPSPATASPNPDLEGLMDAHGVPAVNITMASPYYHTVDDTPEKIPPEQLERSVSAYRELLEQLQTLPAGAIRLNGRPGFA